MLEIPEALTIATQINETLRGKTIKNVVAAHSPHGFAFYYGEPADYPALLHGKSIGKASAIAGFIRVDVDDAQLLFQDGVTIRYLEAGAKRPAKHQLLIEFTDDSALICTLQMYGSMLAFPAGEFENKYYTVAQEKPSPLSHEFSPNIFSKLCAEAPAASSAKALLATEQRIPGLGNGCLQDILFCAQVHPQSKISALREKDLDSLFHSVKNTLAKMVQCGGRDTEKTFFGQEGGYATILSKKTRTKPCPQCGGEITRKAYLGGNVYFCANCQPLKK